MNKRIFYFLSALFRGITCLGCFIAYIVVKITVAPEIIWLNLLLLFLSLGALLSGIFNLCLCGLTATSYRQNRWMQILCLIFTIFTGGIASTAFTAMAVAIRPKKEEIENENLFKIKK